MGEEKRKYTRAWVALNIFIRLPKKHTIVANTENMGEKGFRANIEEKLDASSLVGLEIYLGNEKILSEGKIIYTIQLKEDPICYATGIEFQRMKEKDRDLIKKYVNEIALEK